MSTETGELTYHGRPLDPHPIAMRLGDVAARLLESRVTQVVLEPGDATRYDFILAPVATVVADVELPGVDALFVGRTLGVNGRLVATAIIPSPTHDVWQFEQAIEAISLFEGRPGNEWCCELFAWWFEKLWARLEGRA